MSNRTTVKSNITTLNVPSVTNAIMNQMLNDEIADNVVFREDVAVLQSSVISNITVDFSGKDRVDLTRTGGSLNITVSNIGDGEVKYLLITKTAGQAVTFVGVTDITPVPANANAVDTVLYEIVRKASYYYARAYVKSPLTATDTVLGIISLATQAENNSLTTVGKVCTPGRLPLGTTSQCGLLEVANATEVDAGTDAHGSYSLAVAPSDLLRKLADLVTAITTPSAWVNLTLNTTYFSGAYSGYHLKAFVDYLGFVHIWGQNIRVAADLTNPSLTYAIVSSLPAAYGAPSGDSVYILAPVVNISTLARRGCYVQVNSGDLVVAGNADFTVEQVINFYIHFRK